MAKDYPEISKHLHRCLELCKWWVKTTANNYCNLKLQGKNILGNNNGVFRQHIHTDYSWYNHSEEQKNKYKK